MKRAKIILSTLVLLTLGLFFYVSRADAALTKQLSYQGRLLDASGVPVPNGTYTVVFSIYNVSTGGAPLWTETQNVVVDKGGFSVYLGSVTPLAILFNEDYFLGIKVGSDPEMTPRLKLAIVGASAFALDAANLGGQPPSNYAPAAHSHSFGSLTGAVAISPSANQVIQATSAGVTPLGIKGQTGQSVPYFTVEDNAGGRFFAVMPDGHVLIPNPNKLHIVNMDNDSPAGPMGNMTIDVLNNSGTSNVNVINSDPSFASDLTVEGGIFTDFGLLKRNTPGALTLTASNGSVIVNAFNAAGPSLVQVQNADAVQVANLDVEGNIGFGGNAIKHNVPGTLDIQLNDAGNTILNITNPGAGTASLQVEGATVVTSVNGIVANPSATQNVVAQNAATTPLSIKAAPSPTAPIFEVTDDAGIRKLAVMPDGHVFIPGSSQLHVLNINNDSPTGPMGNMTVDVMNSTGNSKLVLQNSNATFQAALDVEGAVLIGNPATTTARLSAYETGTVNSGGFFEINNAANTSTAVTGVITSGGGPAGAFQINDGSNTDSAVAVATAGTGYAGYFEVSNATNASAGVYSVITQGSGPAFLGEVSAFSTGSAGMFQILNGADAAPLLAGDNSGTGNLLQLKQSGVDKFVVDNSGNVTANGSIKAFNGANSVPVSNVAAQQLIVAVAGSGTGASFAVAFPVTFSGIPKVFVAQDSGGAFKSLFASAITTTGFTMNSSGGAINYFYIAVGDK